MSTEPFYPSPFYKFGNVTKELLTKKFRTEHSLKSIGVANNSVLVESGVDVADNGALKGYFKVDSAKTRYGAVNLELQTDPATPSTVTFRPALPAKNLWLATTLASSDKDRAFKQPVVGSVDLKYLREGFYFATTAKTDSETHKLDASASVGYSGVAVGGGVVVDVSKGADLQDFNYGIEYVQPEYTAAIVTEKKGTAVTASYGQRLGKDHVLAAAFKYDLQGKNERSLSVGTTSAIDARTRVSAKVDIPSGDVSTTVEHLLTSPASVRVGISNVFNIRNVKLGSDKIAIAVLVGDV